MVIGRSVRLVQFAGRICRIVVRATCNLPPLPFSGGCMQVIAASMPERIRHYRNRHAARD
jgi:hypothetical protein